MGCLVWPTTPTGEEPANKSPTNGSRVMTKSPDDIKGKPVKNHKKPPRFLKLESVEPKNGTDKPRSGNCEEDFVPEPVPDQQVTPQPQPQQQIPVAIPYTPQYAVQYPPPYPVPSYPIQPVQESVPVDPQPIATVSYPEHQPHYMEPPYTIPYMVYTHPQYYYPN